MVKKTVFEPKDHILYDEEDFGYGIHDVSHL